MTKKHSSEPKYLIIGEILRPHGVKGEMRIKVITDYPERLLDDEVEYVFVGRHPDQEAPRFTLHSARFHQGYLLIQLDEINGRDEAESLRGQVLMIDLEHAIPLEEDEYYLYQLIGMTVFTESGEEIGVVTEIIETGANDVYIVNSRAYGQVLLPAHEETIVEIDLEQQKIIMNLPDGILPR